jgi:hypothetical protein
MYESWTHTPASGCSIGSGKASLGSSIADNRGEFSAALRLKLESYQDANSESSIGVDPGMQASAKVMDWKSRLGDLLNATASKQDDRGDLDEWDGQDGQAAAGVEKPEIGMQDFGDEAPREESEGSESEGAESAAVSEGQGSQTGDAGDTDERSKKRKRSQSWDQFATGGTMDMTRRRR